jgi:transglutaminase-like putative cysteine protease
MTLDVTHTTTYLYSEAVTISYNEVHLAPRPHDSQIVVSHELTITPPPDFSAARRDYFGNEVTWFSTYEPHQTLTITAQDKVQTVAVDPPRGNLVPAWEQVRDAVRQRESAEAFEACQFVFESPRVKLGPAFAAYAAPSFAHKRPLVDAVGALSRRIFAEFEYDIEATTVTTPVDEVLKTKHGVCQDYAHAMIACLRSLGLPARYVSGYVHAGTGLVGAQASHAWVSAFCPGFGWVDFDPTNGIQPQEEHVTLAWGRDYSDVTPVKGIAFGGGDHVINATVTVKHDPQAS